MCFAFPLFHLPTHSPLSFLFIYLIPLPLLPSNSHLSFLPPSLTSYYVHPLSFFFLHLMQNLLISPLILLQVFSSVTFSSFAFLSLYHFLLTLSFFASLSPICLFFFPTTCIILSTPSYRSFYSSPFSFLFILFSSGLHLSIFPSLISSSMSTVYPPH